MKFKLCMILIVSLLFVNIVNAAVGVGYPFPSQLELKPGESGRFQFEIQTTPEEGLVTCSYNLEQQIPLIVEFDEQSIPITPTGQSVRMPVYATVTAPIETEPGTYSTTFCVSCAPAKSGQPIGAVGSYCGISFGVNVVGERTRENPYVPPKPTKANIWLYSILLITLILLIILTVYLVKKVIKRR